MADWTLSDSDVTPTLWLDANDDSTIDAASGLVTRWRDKNGLDICGSVGIDTYRPTVVPASLNGLPGIACYSGNNMAVTNLDRTNMIPLGHPANYTIFMVCRKTEALTNDICGVSYDSVYYKWGTLSLVSWAPNALYWTRSASTSRYNSGWTVADSRLAVDNPVLIALQYTNGDIADVIRLDGTTLGNVVVDGSWTYSGGTARTYYLAFSGQCVFYEFIVFNTSISADLAQKIEGYLAWKWGLQGELPFSHPYKDAAPAGPGPVRALLDQPWSIKTGTELVQPWGDAPVSRALLYQPWSDAPVVRSLLKQPWSDALAARSLLVQPWAIAADARALLVQPWAITAEGVRALLDQPWAIEDYNPVRSLLDQPWAIAANDSVGRYAVSCTVGGQVVRPQLVTIEGDLDEDSLLCELQLATEDEYARCRDGLELVVIITSNEATESFAFIITSARINEEHGNTQYVVEALSATALFGPPYSEGQSGELTGMASAIASGLVGPVVWQTVDWEINSGVWSAAGETSLELLRQLAASVRAVVQSDPDGSIRVQAEYRIPVNQWAAATPDRILVENLDCFSVGSTFDPRSGRNRFLVGDQAVSGDRATLELADIATGLKEARAYQVPWKGDLTLTHTGGAWASITAMGIEERLVSETVEIVSGSGQTQYPVYGAPVVSWLQNNLGTVTASEGGVITAQIAGESLAAITYRTRCMLWQVRDAKPEQLQLVVKQ